MNFYFKLLKYSPCPSVSTQTMAAGNQYHFKKYNKKSFGNFGIVFCFRSFVPDFKKTMES